MRALTVPLTLASVALTSACGTRSSEPIMARDAIEAGVARALAGCTAPLDANGDIDEAGLRAAGWQPVRRKRSDPLVVGNQHSSRDTPLPLDRPANLTDGAQYEMIEWRHAGVPAVLYHQRNGGPWSERVPAECDISFRGETRDTADAVRALLVRRYGRPVRIGTRSAGGDWLTPRWFEPEIHSEYWRLPQHDVYWVSSDRHFGAIEVVAMPDRAHLYQFSSAQPDSRVYIPEPTPTAAP